MDKGTERLIAKLDARLHTEVVTPRRRGAGAAAVTGAPELTYSWENDQPAKAQDVAHLTSITRQLAAELEEKGRALAAMRALLFPGMDADAIRDHLLALADGLGIDIEHGW